MARKVKKAAVRGKDININIAKKPVPDNLRVVHLALSPKASLYLKQVLDTYLDEYEEEGDILTTIIEEIKAQNGNKSK